MYIIQLYVTIKLTKKEKKSVYLRCFIKATILSISSISPIYICMLAVIVDFAIISTNYRKESNKMAYPKIWLSKGTLSNFALILIYLIGEKKLVLYVVISTIFLIILLEFIEHYYQAK